MTPHSKVRLELQQDYAESLLNILASLLRVLSPSGVSTLDCFYHDLQQAVNDAKQRDLNTKIAIEETHDVKHPMKRVCPL